MGLTVRSDKQNAEIYLKQDGDDVDIHLVTPDGTDIIIAWFDEDGQFTLAYPDEDGVPRLKSFVKLDEDNLLSVSS